MTRRALIVILLPVILFGITTSPLNARKKHLVQKKLDIYLSLKNFAGSKDDNHAFEDLEFNLKLQLNPLPKNRARFFLDFRWLKGALFLFPFFFDLSDLAGGTKLSGILSEEKLYISKWKLWGPIQLSGQKILISLSNSGEGIKNPIEKFKRGTILFQGDIKKLFKWLVLDQFSDSKPKLKEIEPEGILKIIIKPSKISLELNGDLSIYQRPFLQSLIIRAVYPIKGNNCESGLIDWEKLYLKAFLPKVFNSDSTISVHGNKIPLKICKQKMTLGPVRLELDSSYIEISKVILNLSSKTLSVASIKSDPIQLKQLIPSLPIDVLMKINLKNGHFIGEKFQLTGDIELKLANGIIIIKDIWMDPKAPIFRFGGDIQFNRIDLYEITSKTSFGAISGSIKGYIKNLVMSGIQPEEFQLLIETDTSSNAPEKISIKAIENLSILGGGDGSISFLGQMFKEFSYSRIGIKCKLKNDVFELHGLIKSGKKEYLVKRGFWGGVNVINMNPKGKISFRDMIDRLKRITETDKRKMEVR